ncbi:MAG TPA: tetratricopeptide repeat protein [Cyclobacteriaceae bacterium]|nr:tetratricopeptide repeat protein [Cyclobacteriaceae bacterium]
MTAIRVHSILLLGIAFCILPLAVHAQKKKKGHAEQSQGIKEREAEFYFTEGEKYFILEDYAKALLYYQKSLEVNASNATVHYKIAEVLSRSQRQDDMLKASISIENALKLETKNKYFYLLAVNIYNTLARFDKAAQTYETMMREVEGTEEYLYDLAAVYQYDKKPTEAIRVYNKAEALFGVNEISSVQKLRLYLEAGEAEEAIAEGDKLLEAYPGEERYVMGFAEVMSKNGQLPVALEYLEKFVRENPDASNAKMLLAGFYRDTKEEVKARTLLTELFSDPSVELGSKVIVLGAYNTELHQNRARNQPDSDKEAYVLSLYQKLVQMHPGQADVYVIGGDLYLSTGKNADAVTAYQQAIKSGDVNYEVWQNLIYLETQLNQFDNVIRHTDEALELFPNQGMLYYFSGYAHLRKRQHADASMALEQAKKIISGDKNLLGEINGMLGDTYNSMKQYEKSDKAYEDALGLNPDNDVVLNNYSYFLALRKANLEKAEKMSTQLVKNNPDNPVYLDTHAWVLYTREKYREAKKIMERAINTGNVNATHFEHYGDILFKLGDVNGAVTQWEKAKEADADNELLNKKIANRKIYE